MDPAIWALVALAVVFLVVRFFVMKSQPRVSLDAALRDPARRPEALRLLDGRLTRALGASDVPAALQGVASYATVLLEAGAPRAAADLLGKIPIEKLPPAPRAIAANNQAIAHLDLHEIDGARAALDRVDERPDGDVGAVVASTDALITALEGRHAEAIALCDAAEALPETKVDVTSPLTEARATALAGLDRLDEARAVLEKHIEDSPDAVTLDTMVERKGPASSLAAELIRARSAPT